MRSPWMTLTLLPFVLAACADPPPPVAPPSPSASMPPAPAASHSSAPPVAASAVAVVSSAPQAKLGAPVDGRFAHAVSCKVTDSPDQMTVWPVGKGLLGTCGSAVTAAGVFYVAENGQVRLAPEVFKELPMGSVISGGFFGVYRVAGSDLEHLEASIGDMGSRTGQTYTFRKNGAQWKKVNGTNQAGVDESCWGWCVKVDGHPLVESRGTGKFEYNDGHKGWLPGQTAAPGCNESVHDFALLFVQGKELWGVGMACGKTAVLRSTIAGSNTTAQSLDLPAFHGFQGRLHQAGNRWIYEGGGGRILVLFDGQTWSPLASYENEQTIEMHSMGGKTWVWTAKQLHWLDGTKLTEVRVPDEKISLLRFSDGGEMRVWTGKGLYSLDGDTTWHSISLPTSITDMRQLDYAGGRWMYQVVAKDDDKLNQLFIEGATGAPIQMLDPHPAISPMAYVRPIDVFVNGAAARAMAGPSEGFHLECEQPFAMLYKLAKTAPKDYDFPATKKALVGHAELQAGRFSEVEAFGDRYLVVQFDGPQARKRLGDTVQLIKKEVPGSTPQLLCADAVPNGLPTTRTVNMK